MFYENNNVSNKGGVVYNSKTYNIFGSIKNNNKINILLKCMVFVVISLCIYVNKDYIYDRVTNLYIQVSYKSHATELGIFSSNDSKSHSEKINSDEVIGNNKSTYVYSPCKSNNRISISKFNGIRDDNHSFDNLEKRIKNICELNSYEVFNILNASDLQNDKLYTLAACILINKSPTITDSVIDKIAAGIRGDENMVEFKNCL